MNESEVKFLMIEIGGRQINPLTVSRTQYYAAVPPVSGEQDERVLNGDIVKDDNGYWRWSDEYDFFTPKTARLTVHFTDGQVWEFSGAQADDLRQQLRLRRL